MVRHAVDEIIELYESELEKFLGEQWMEDYNESYIKHLERKREGFKESFPEHGEWKLKYVKYLGARYKSLRKAYEEMI